MPETIEEFLIKRFEYFIGYTPDLQHPSSFSEKILWRKLFDRRAILAHYSDKVAMKELAAELDTDDLRPIPAVVSEGMRYVPHEFPLIVKPSNYSGETRVIEDGEQWWKAVSYYDKMPRTFGNDKGAWAYSQVPFRMIVEPVITGYTEIKVHVFGGESKMIRLCEKKEGAPASDKATGRRTHFDATGKRLDVTFRDIAGGGLLPDWLDVERVCWLAEQVAGTIDFVRVDLLCKPGVTYLCECTVYPSGGWNWWTPSEYDDELGSYWQLPQRTN